MNNSYNIILDILKAYIKNEDYIIDDNCIDWEELIQKCREHQILSLIYYCIGRNNLKHMPAAILEKWKHDVFLSNICEIKKMNRYRDIINGIRSENIEVVALKGIVLKEYYPKMELRTMSDLDLLVHEEDFQKVKEYLVENSFTYVNDNHPVHARFYDENSIKLEVHWKLINNENYVADTVNFEKYIWDELIEYKENGIEGIRLNTENFLLHLCIHMAKHLRNSGFGLRQLFDIVIYCDKEKNNIDWNKFVNKAEECGALKFTKALFILINKKFEMNIPLPFTGDNTLLDYDPDMFLKDIFSYNKYKNEIYIKSNKAITRKEILRLIFPKVNELIEKYPYARNKVLLPAAWVNMIIIVIIRNAKSTIKSIYNNIRFKELIKRRRILLNEFGL